MKNNPIDMATRYEQLKSNLLHSGYQGDLLNEHILDGIVDEIMPDLGSMENPEEVKKAMIHMHILGRVQGEHSFGTELKEMALSTITSIFHHGEFKVETANERVLLNLLKMLGYWPTTNEEISKRSIPEDLFKKLNIDI